jgi:hypothetical protein
MIHKLVMASCALFFASIGCTKTVDDLRVDGFQCRQGLGGPGSVPKGKEHCFICDDNDSMIKCTKNPLTSGCREVKQAECMPPPK